MVVDNGLARCRFRATGVIVLSSLRTLRRLTIVSILVTLGPLTILLTLTSRFVAQALFTQVGSLLDSLLGILDTLQNPTANQHQNENNEKENE